MLCRDIMSVIETTYPRHAALEWDHVGLLAGRTEKEVKTIYVALDATEEVIDAAIRQGVDMLITHHPMLFSPLKKITDECLIGRRVVSLLQHDISYYAMHTNYDVLRMAELSGEILGLQDAEIVEITDAANREGIGRIGFLPEEMTLKECCELVKQKFELDAVTVFGDMDKLVKRVAISPGSGKHMTEFAVEKGADVFVSADLGYHEIMDSVAEGTAIIDAGHYGLESIFVNDMATFLKERIQGVEVLAAPNMNPIRIV